eukprot:6104291-Amphidinium_carterae.1
MLCWFLALDESRMGHRKTITKSQGNEAVIKSTNYNNNSNWKFNLQCLRSKYEWTAKKTD